MENLHVSFTVRVSETEYSYQGRHAEAEVKIQVPREVLLALDPGNLFTGALQAALANYDKAEEEAAQEEK